MCICTDILAPEWEIDSERKKLKYGYQLGKSDDGIVWEAAKSQIWDVLKVETAGLADEQD